MYFAWLMTFVRNIVPCFGLGPHHCAFYFRQFIIEDKCIPKCCQKMNYIPTIGLFLGWQKCQLWDFSTEAYLKSSLNFIPSVFFSSLFLCMICNHAKMYMFNVNEVQHVLFWYSVIEVILIIIYLLDIILLWAAFSKNIKTPLS